MSGNESNQRIKFAYLLENWNYENGSRPQLISNSERTLPTEYQQKMEGFLFCPSCFTNLTRVPKDKEVTSNGKDAYFAHMAKYKNVFCNLRTPQATGKRYENYEQAKKAIDDEELVIVSGFMKTKPEASSQQAGPYDATAIEDLDGPLTEVAIGRHNGETFALPSKIKTINGICRNFDKNYYKYFHLPERKNAIQLKDLLVNMASLSEVNNVEGFYYGKITSSMHHGAKLPKNIRSTYLAVNPDGAHDFCLKTPEHLQKSHGIDERSVGRILIVFSSISHSGIGLCFKDLGWGELALLPEKYEHILK
jgi:hypothetical protein